MCSEQNSVELYQKSQIANWFRSFEDVHDPSNVVASLFEPPCRVFRLKAICCIHSCTTLQKSEIRKLLNSFTTTATKNMPRTLIPNDVNFMFILFYEFL